MNTEKVKYTFLIVLCIILCSCGKSEISIPDSAKLVLHSILEYPNEDLYTPSTSVIGMDNEPKGADQEEMESNTQKWREAIGDCFAGDMFDSFYNQWEKDGILGYAYANDLTITVTDMQLLNQNDDVWHVQTTIAVTDSDTQKKSYNLEWRIIFDKDAPELIQSIKLLDDAGLFDSKS